jgi:hypothetical protein
MSLPFLNTASGYDEELRNSVFCERGLHAASWRPTAPAGPSTPVRREAGEEVPRQRREVPPKGPPPPSSRPERSPFLTLKASRISPRWLTSAGERWSRDSYRPFKKMNHATAAMCIDNPLQHHEAWYHHLYDTHPPIEQRIDDLEKLASAQFV